MLMLSEKGYRSGMNMFWIFLALAGLGALVYFVFYPAYKKIQARNAVLDMIKEAEKEGEYPPYRATVPGKCGEEAIKLGKVTIFEIGMALRNDKRWVREKAIYVVEQITGKKAFDWGYDYETNPNEEANVKAIAKIEAWYQQVKDDPNVK
jgi:hypothetical protein